MESEEPEPQVYVCGSGECDQLGLDDIFEARRPRVLRLPEPVHSISCGGLHTAALTVEGRLYTWGCNDDGALGRTGPANLPGLVQGLGAVNAVTTGDSHTLALNSQTNQLYMWGTYRDMEGNMRESTPMPLLITEIGGQKPKIIMQIASGANHSLVLADSKVYAWGDGAQGQIGRYLRSRNKRVSSLRMTSVGFRGAAKIFCGEHHSFILTEDQRVFGWGLNNYGQLGDGTNVTKFSPVEIYGLSGIGVIQIKGAVNHTLALTADGQVLVCGRNDDFQLGLGDDRDQWEPQLLNELQFINYISAGGHSSYAIDRQGKVFAWGAGDCFMMCNAKEESIATPVPIPICEHKTFVSVSAGSQHLVLLRHIVDLQLPTPQKVELKRKFRSSEGPYKKMKLNEAE